MSAKTDIDETLKKLGMDEDEMKKFADGARFILGDAPPPPVDPKPEN